MSKGGTSRRAVLAGAGAAWIAPIGRAKAQAARVVADSAGRSVTVPARVTRVFAAGPPASILLFGLAPDLLIGWTSAFRPAEREFVPERYANLPELGRLTGRGNSANVEVVLAAKPDLIFDYGSIGPTYVSLADRVQQQTGIPYLLIDGRFDRIADAYGLLGDIVGRPADAARFAAYARATLSEIDRGLAGIPAARRPRVYYGRGPSGLQTGARGSINTEIIERAGAVNVAAETLGTAGLVNVSMEQILQWDPDFVVTIDPNFFAAVTKDPLWQGVKAIRDRRVFLSPNLPYGWIDFPPAVNRLLGLRWLCGLFYPDAFPADIRPIARDFYTLFYHRTPSAAQLDRLLTEALPKR